MNNKNIYKTLYWVEVAMALVVSSGIAIALSVWLFRTLSGMNQGYDSIPERIVGAIIIMALIIVWIVANNPYDIIYDAKRRYRYRTHKH